MPLAGGRILGVVSVTGEGCATFCERFGLVFRGPVCFFVFVRCDAFPPFWQGLLAGPITNSADGLATITGRNEALFPVAFLREASRSSLINSRASSRSRDASVMKPLSGENWPGESADRSEKSVSPLVKMVDAGLNGQDSTEGGEDPGDVKQ